MNITHHADYNRMKNRLMEYFQMSHRQLPRYIKENYGGNYEAFLLDFGGCRNVGVASINLLRKYLEDVFCPEKEVPTTGGNQELESYDGMGWKYRQYKIAKDVFCALIDNYNDYEPSGDDVVRMAKYACECADTLIDVLRGNLK